MNETITTITIKTSNGEVTDVIATPIPVAEKPVLKKSIKKKNKHGNRDNYAVQDIELLNKVIDAGLIEFLHGIHIADDKRKSWHFDKVPAVKVVMDKYIAEKHTVNAEN